MHLMAPQKARSKPLKGCWFRPKCKRRCQELIRLHRGLTLRSPRNTQQLQPAVQILTAGYSRGHLLVPGSTEQINPGSCSNLIRQEPLNHEFLISAGAGATNITRPYPHHALEEGDPPFFPFAYNLPHSQSSHVVFVRPRDKSDLKLGESEPVFSALLWRVG